jgi:hypothetical protein
MCAHHGLKLAIRFRNATRWNAPPGSGRDGTEKPPGQCPDNGAVGVSDSQPVLADQLLSQRARSALSQLNRMVNVAPDQAKALADFEKNAAQVARTIQLTGSVLPRVVLSANPVRPIRSPATAQQVRETVAAADKITAFMKSDISMPAAAAAAAARADSRAVGQSPSREAGPWPSTDDLSPSQKAAALKIRVHLPAGLPPPANAFIVLGMPGTGKSFLIEHLHEICHSVGVGIRTGAPAAVAAVPIRGQTLHSLVGLQGTLSPDTFPPPPSPDVMHALRAQWHGVRLLVIDEISMVSQALLGCVSRRLSQILQSEAHFGGLVVVFSGDFDQLAPVPLPSMVHVGLGCTTVKPGSPAALARDIFQRLDLCPVTHQKRCTDPAWNAVLNATRSSRSLRTLAENLRELTKEESDADPEWAFATIATNGNDQRLRMNWMQSERWAGHTG